MECNGCPVHDRTDGYAHRYLVSGEADVDEVMNTCKAALGLSANANTDIIDVLFIPLIQCRS